MSQDHSLSPQDIIELRTKAKERLNGLETELRSSTTPYQSWLNGNIPASTSHDCRFFDANGFLHLPAFSESVQVAALKQQMHDLVESQWDPANQTTSSFSTNVKDNEAQGSNDYFLESAARIHFFAEPNALEKDGHSLKPQYTKDKMAALNKAGHGMHTQIDGAFYKYTTSNKIGRLVHDLGYRDAIVPQSMYIFKQPKIGGAVHSHQDSTFLFTEPRQSCLGLWLALDDATLENGCLWVRPKSHFEPVRRQFRRNPAHFTEAVIHARQNVGKGDLDEPKMIFTELDKDESSKMAPWEGALPQDLWGAGFVPVECKAGDLLAFCGQLDHLSLPNVSDRPRHTFQLHLVEGPAAGVEWSKSNWLQYPPDKSFLSIK